MMLYTRWRALGPLKIHRHNTIARLLSPTLNSALRYITVSSNIRDRAKSTVSALQHVPPTYRRSQAWKALQRQYWQRCRQHDCGDIHPR